MRIISDLHIHSRFSRATSHAIDIAALEKWARVKGLNLLGTGDFLHPGWLAELRSSLVEDGSGFLYSENGFMFVLSNEISLVYAQNKKIRKIHFVILAPDFATVDQIADCMQKYGDLESDGRPTFNLTAIEFIDMLRGISHDIEIIPAHVWTPWFGLFGSKSGFDTIEEAFGDNAKYIHALETGLSSDPLMNWTISALDKYNLVSFSDAHSFWPWRLGREATIFDIKPDYKHLISAIRTGEGLEGTVEVDPAYGKYHFDGHRNCGVCLEPKLDRTLCPVCGKPLTIGVLHRVLQLADRPLGFIPKGKPTFKKAVPLAELIAHIFKSNLNSQRVLSFYRKMIDELGSEFEILFSIDMTAIKKFNNKLAELIEKLRENKLYVQPGYDGVYGVLTDHVKEICPQSTLDDF